MKIFPAGMRGVRSERVDGSKLAFKICRGGVRAGFSLGFTSMANMTPPTGDPKAAYTDSQVGLTLTRDHKPQ